MLEDAPNQELLAAWQRGDEQAAQILVRRYMVRLTALARSRLSRKLARRLDPEDIVLSAWRSFFVAADNGRVEVPMNDNLWPLLVTMTLRKLARQATRQSAQQRDVEAEVHLDQERSWQSVVSREPSPDEAAMVVDEVERLMAVLDPADREVLTRLLQGERQTEIAAAVGCSERTVRRSMQTIRDRIEQWHPRGAASPITTAVTPPPRVVTMPSAASRDESTVDYADLLLQRLIGQGGFGKVYLARRKSNGAAVAVKFLKKQFWKDARSVQCMLDETARVSALSHPNIIRHYGWGRTQPGAVFVVMDWIDGTDAAVWRRRSQPKVAEIIECGLAMADALAAAHAAGIVHGDVTPGNILRRSDGTFVLTDFGFARSLSAAPRPHSGGTPGFLTPEQISDAFGPISERTDVYGLGGLLYALLTGHSPMTGPDAPETLANVLSSRPPVPPGRLATNIPAPFEELVLRCLNKETTERPRSMTEVRASLLSLRESLRTNKPAAVR